MNHLGYEKTLKLGVYFPFKNLMHESVVVSNLHLVLVIRCAKKMLSFQNVMKMITPCPCMDDLIKDSKNHD